MSTEAPKKKKKMMMMVMMMVMMMMTNVINCDQIVEQFNPQCQPKSTAAEEVLLREIYDYEKNHRFKTKIIEVRGLKAPDPRQHAILNFLKENVLAKDMSVLDMGCAAGNVLKLVSESLTGMGGYGNLTGIELVPGWVTEGNKALQGIAKLHRGDSTELYLGGKYDLMMMNDVLEHVMTDRYGCLFANIDKYAKEGSYVYFHLPSPTTQLYDRGQYFENVVPPHLIVVGLATFGFELHAYEQDVDTKINGKTVMARHDKPVTKYVHLLFRKTSEDVFRSKTSEKPKY